MKTKLGICLLIFLTLFPVTGCWDNRDIGKRAFVTAIGLDSTDNDVSAITESSKTSKTPKKYKVTFEIVKPVLLTKFSTQRPASIIRTVEADSIVSALQEVQSSISRQVGLTHMRVLVVGDKIARQNFKDYADFFEKTPDVARRLRVMFVENSQAADVFQTKPPFEKYVAEELVTMTQLEPKLPLVRTNSFSNLIRELRATEGRAFGNRIMVSEDDKTIIRTGGSVFDKWKLIGWLNAAETEKANWLVGKAETTVENKTGQYVYTYSVNAHSVSLKPVVDGKQLKFTVKVKTDGMIIHEQGQPIDITKPKNLVKLEKLFSQVITKEIESAISKAQKEIGVDYLGFGQALKKSNPEFFKKINWDETFPTVPVEVEVKAHIGMVSLSR